MTDPAHSSFDDIRGRLRLLETTDLHMHLRGFDYFAHKQDNRLGLASLIDDIATQRDAGIATMLFDNGDFLQGNPLADHTARTLGPAETHPMIAAMNLLEYDAITLGNHEFDYGLAFLRQVLSKSACPVVSANVSCTAGDDLAVSYSILEKAIVCNDGQTRSIKVGVTGFAPPVASDWGSDEIADQVYVGEIVTCARQIVPQIKAAGADLVVALSHSGIGTARVAPSNENASLQLAAVDGIDVVLMGHTHEVFPDPQAIPTADRDIDHKAGTLHGKPAVMAGFYGRALGIVDLDLRWGAGAWQVAACRSGVTQPSGKAPSQPRARDFDRITDKAHAQTLAALSQPFCRTNIHLQSYFATVQPDQVGQLVAQVIKDALRDHLKGTAHDELPVLGAVAPFRYGGPSGLGHYIDIPQGAVTLREAAAIFPFNDSICAVRRTGAQIRNWLERSASHYNQITKGTVDQRLINPQSAGYNCDAIYGLRYEIDLTQPARFDPYGQIIDAANTRISALEWQGRLVLDDDLFVVGTNSFRAKGGGGFARINRKDLLWLGSAKLRDVLVEALSKRGTITDAQCPVWTFRNTPNTAALFKSAARAKDHLPVVITHLGADDDGFDSYRIHL